MIFSIIGCEKDNPSKPSEPIAEIDKLPPATQIGANKIGCLLDGKAFMPGYYNNSTNCWYQFANGKYSFCVAFNNNDNDIFRGFSINTNGLTISQGQTLVLKDNVSGSPTGRFQYQYYSTFTDSINIGEFKITKLDPTNYIVSGTFWYNIIDYQGVKHEIREGRFDMRYTS